MRDRAQSRILRREQARNPSLTALAIATKQRPDVRRREIEARDLEAVVDCLARGFPERTKSYWLAGLVRMAEREAMPGLPRFGHCLAADGEIVGVLLQMFSRRETPAGPQILCHLSSWCVDEVYRAFGPALHSISVKRKDVTYVNISPARHTRAGIEALGFRPYNLGQMLFAPILSRPRRDTSVSDFDADSGAAELLPNEERRILADHAALGCRSLIGMFEGAAYGFVFMRRNILKGRLPCQQVLYCRNGNILANFAHALGRHRLLESAPLFVIDADGPIAGLRGRFARGSGAKYYSGPLAPKLGDLAYSELAFLQE